MLLLLLAALVLSNLVAVGLKTAVRRPRPPVMDAPRPSVASQMHDGAWHSFPSGDTLVDTAMVIALWGMVGYRGRWSWLLLVPLSVGAQRIIAAAHYPSDVVAGWTIGALIGGLIVDRAVRITSREEAAEDDPARTLPRTDER